MELKDKFISSFSVDNQTPYLSQLRLEAFERFKEEGFPTKKQEAWRFTSLVAILNQEYEIFPQVAEVNTADAKPYFLEEEAHRLVFVNGVFQPSLSSPLRDKVEVVNMASVLEDPKYTDVIKEYWNQTTNTADSFTNLNTALAKEGAFVKVPKSQVVDKPIEIIYLTSMETNAFCMPRNLIVVEENAQAKIVEKHYSLTNNSVITNAVTEIYAAKNAMVDYYKLQNDADTSNLIDNTYIAQHKDTEVSVHTFCFGGNITRNNLNFYHKGEHINSILKGITIIGGKQLVDHYTLVHHAQPNCQSHQNYKGIFDDRSNGVFNGKILVDKIAQKTDAFQQNNNIILGEKATVNTKPQLEIFADDVKCSHGCTVGQLDDSALFYMQQRGIPQKEAKALLMYAFTNEVMESVEIQSLKKNVQSIIANKLGVSMDFDNDMEE